MLELIGEVKVQSKTQEYYDVSFFEGLNNMYDFDLQFSDQSRELLMKINNTKIFLHKIRALTHTQ